MGKSGKRDRDIEEPDDRERRKEAKKVEKMAKVLGYTSEINPFGDANLLQPFVWGKKKEKDNYEEKRGERKHESRDRTELIEEIEKVRKRRDQRENELAERERLRDEEQRLREASQYDDWQRKEEDFLLNQTEQRSKLRLVNSRELPIDRIAKNILLVETAKKAEKSEDSKDVDLLELEGELANPIDIVKGLWEEDLRQLRKDVADYVELETSKQSKYVEFWECLLKVVTIEEQRLRDKTRRAGGMHESIAKDVADFLKGKSIKELDALESDIEKSLREGRGTDVEYWEMMKSEVSLQRARAVVQATHVRLLEEQLRLLSDSRAEAKARLAREREARGETEEDEEAERQQRRSSHHKKEKWSNEIAIEMGDEEEKMGESEEIFSTVAAGTYWWQDKYRPRKPRFFNRVKTGYFRTKYNLTHYDADNPPPKMIQGYKFTIFYPDLIDKQKTPRYFLEPCADDPNQDFVIIRFHAGPPYEDVAFKIINKEWDTHKRNGFSSMFDRGILTLNFNFKHAFYRR